MAKSLKELVAEARAQIEEVDSAGLRGALQAGEDLLVVDVREPAEYAAGHIEGALSIPRGVLEPMADLEYPARNPELSTARERRVVLYCATGGRSAMGAVALKAMGFGKVQSLAGGVTAWKEGGHALET